MKNIKDLQNAFYINLDERTDRKEMVEKELEKIGINAERFKAIKLDNGAVGCSLSHLKCLQMAQQKKYDYVLICEDDITFLNPEIFINSLNKFLEKNIDWDVILIAGNIIPPYEKIDDCCVKVTNCQTTTGYIVNQKYYSVLMDNIKAGVNKLIKNPEKHIKYAIDKYWFELQEKDNWYLITPLTVIQKPGFSDIEKKNTNYSKIMTDLNKLYLLKKK